MSKKKIRAFLAALSASVLLASCGNAAAVRQDEGPEAPSSPSVQEDASPSGAGGSSTSSGISGRDAYAVPEHTGQLVTMNGGRPYFLEGDLTVSPYETYSDLDGYGRAGQAMACIGPETLGDGSRPAIGDIRPTGWHQAKYEGLVDSNPPYLYNRCHLIAFCLAGGDGYEGINSSAVNLITGTRSFNADEESGMLSVETDTLDYIRSSGNHVLYRVTPVYDGADMLARGVFMEAYSVEDRGVFQRCVFIFNEQDGIDIDYSTGENSLSQTPASDAGEAAEASESTESTAASYVVNMNTGKFHYPGCDSVSDISPQNRKDVTETRDELVSEGYQPCGLCKP